MRRLEKQACAQTGGAAPIFVQFAGEHFGTVGGKKMSQEEFHRRYPRGAAVTFDSDGPEPDTHK